MTLDHVCGLQGFGRGLSDVCPACEFGRLVGLGVPEGIARRAAELRGGMNPDFCPKPYMDKLWEDFKALEQEYDQKIP